VLNCPLMNTKLRKRNGHWPSCIRSEQDRNPQKHYQHHKGVQISCAVCLVRALRESWSQRCVFRCSATERKTGKAGGEGSPQCFTLGLVTCSWLSFRTRNSKLRFDLWKLLYWSWVCCRCELNLSSVSFVFRQHQEIFYFVFLTL